MDAYMHNQVKDNEQPSADLTPYIYIFIVLVVIDSLGHWCITKPRTIIIPWCLSPIYKHGHQSAFNSLRPRQNARHFADDIFNSIFLNDNARISHKIPLKFVPKVRINNIPALVQIMAWRRPGDKPLSEPMMVSLPTHICVTRPQWVNALKLRLDGWRFPIHFLEWKCTNFDYNFM